MALYDLVRDETGDPRERHAAAEALERFGLLRRRRAGPTPMFVWLAAMTLVVCAAAAWTTVGPVAGVALLLAAGWGGRRVLAHVRRPRGPDDVFLGPYGEEFPLPRPPGGPPTEA